MKVFALIADFPIEACNLSHTPPPTVRTFVFTRKTFVEITKFVQGVLQRLWVLFFSPVLSVKYASFMPKSAPTL